MSNPRFLLTSPGSKTPLLHIKTKRSFRLTTGVTASPWMWAKARSERGALICLCGDGVVSNVARMDGVVLHGNNLPLLHIETDRSFLPTTSTFQMPSVGVPASPWMWAKARSKRGALICLCGDGVVSNEARMGSFCMEIIYPFLT
jgi:hypothetical protein